MKTNILLLIGLLLITTGSLHAQFSESISSDRPGQANSPNVVGTKVLQFQLGYDNFFTNIPEDGFTPGVKSHTMGSNLGIRYGINEKFEVMTLLNYQFDRFKVANLDPITQNGLSVAQVLVRSNLIEQSDGIIPAVGLGVGLALPVNSAPYEINNAAPEIQIATSHAVGSKGTSIGTFWVASWDGNTAQPTWKYVVNCFIPIADDGKLSVFVENYGNVNNGTFSTYFDGGFAWVANNNIQLDLGGGTGINRGVMESYISLGFSGRKAFGR